MVKEMSPREIAQSSMGLLGAGHTPGAIGPELAQIGVKAPEPQRKMPTKPSMMPVTEASLNFQDFQFVVPTPCRTHAESD
jgi:hypothetical protein